MPTFLDFENLTPIHTTTTETAVDSFYAKGGDLYRVHYERRSTKTTVHHEGGLPPSIN